MQTVEERAALGASKLDSSKLWAEIVTQPAIQDLSPENRLLVDNVARLGHMYARSEPDYDGALLQYMRRWTKEVSPVSSKRAHSEERASALENLGSIYSLCYSYITNYSCAESGVRPNTTVYPVKYVYNTDSFRTKVPEVSVKKYERAYMKRLIPLSYALFGILFLSLSLIFGFMFYLGLHGNGYLIGPWTNLMLLIASVGLTATVAVAVVEWRKLQDEGDAGQGGAEEGDS